jgi:hypothetical protein
MNSTICNSSCFTCKGNAFATVTYFLEPGRTIMPEDSAKVCDNPWVAHWIYSQADQLCCS